MSAATSLTHLLLGTNMGNRCGYLQFAQEMIQQNIGTICRYSPVYETSPWGYTQQADFLNQALVVQTHCSPEQLLTLLQEIETKAGRQRLMHWGPRTLDIDIIAIENKVICSERLQVPHPALAQRRFVLQPLAEIAPEWQHPLSRLTYRQMLASCRDNTIVKKYDCPLIFDCKRI
ncbi:MAG: 2-amino-4-hydroxy-6-hydroxymethyldihydropteridine diphosphokinase [Cytophagales bacterium]|nr:2-amino-4-hydroxy-6-hydroxymethyldihydropteridine diphosphokinase [Bernardetiaceae bacterium]MDW8203667.1 2-amino-4-hydroxy-6-hydroxymethyldihydropteridine diphosphokinase [Cytophagales bacterium]